MILQIEKEASPEGYPYQVVSSIPTKNSENTLSYILKSISNQKHRNYEIIGIVNHLTGQTFTIARKYTNKIHLDPEQTAQVNFGIKIAQGKYIHKTESDWIIEPDILDRTVKKSGDEGFDAILVHNSDDARISFGGR